MLLLWLGVVCAREQCSTLRAPDFKVPHTIFYSSCLPTIHFSYPSEPHWKSRGKNNNDFGLHRKSARQRIKIKNETKWQTNAGVSTRITTICNRCRIVHLISSSKPLHTSDSAAVIFKCQVEHLPSSINKYDVHKSITNCVCSRERQSRHTLLRITFAWRKSKKYV